MADEGPVKIYAQNYLQAPKSLVFTVFLIGSNHRFQEFSPEHA